MKSALMVTAFAIVMQAGAAESLAQAYPAKPIRFIDGFPPGGATAIFSISTGLPGAAIGHEETLASRTFNAFLRPAGERHSVTLHADDGECEVAHSNHRD